MQLIQRLVEQHLRSETAVAIAELLRIVATSEEARNATPAARSAAQALLEAVGAKERCFPPELQEEVQAWQLRCVTQAQLFTDDSFQFARAMRRVTDAIRALPAEPDARAATKEAAIACLRTAFDAWKRHRWARSPADLAFKAASEARLRLPEHLRALVDDWATQLHALRAAPQRTHSAWTSEDHAKGTHPLRSVDALRRQLRRQ